MLDALEAPVRVARTGAVVVRLRRRLRSAHEVRTRVRDQHEGDTAVQHGGVVVRVASGDAVLFRVRVRVRVRVRGRVRVRAATQSSRAKPSLRTTCAAAWALPAIAGIATWLGLG